MKTIEELVKGELLLVGAKKVNGGKVQLHFAEVIDNPKKDTSILGLLNASDSRFNQEKAQQAWLSAEAVDIQKLFGIDVSTLENVGDATDIYKLNPTVNGQKLSLEVRETTVAPKGDNPEQYCKKTGSGDDAEIMLERTTGKPVYRNSTVVVGNANHKFIDCVRASEFVHPAVNTNTVNPLDSILNA